MSKIDEFNKQNDIYNRVKTNLFHATRRDENGNYNERNDKGRINFYEKSLNNWNNKQIWVHASYGYYGSSSGYSAMDKETAFYIRKALNELKNEIVKKAIEFAHEDVEKFRIAAVEEAQNILEEIK